jgi:hypothetical protein
MASLQQLQGEQAIREARHQMLLAVAAMLLEDPTGDAWMELKAQGQMALVHAAAERLRAADASKPKVSDIAAVTGVSRNEIPKLLKGSSSRPPTFRQGPALAERLLSEWYARIHDEYGNPRPLRKSRILRLLRRYSNNEPAGPIIKDLMRCGALKKLKNGYYQPVRPTRVSGFRDRETYVAFATELRNLLETFIGAHRSGESAAKREVHFRTVQSDALPAKEAAVLFNRLTSGAQVFQDHAADRFAQERQAAVRSGRPQDTRVLVALQVITTPVSETIRPMRKDRRRPRQREGPNARKGSGSHNGVGAS